MNNVVNNPGEFGLEHIGEIEWSDESYQYDMTAVLRDAKDRDKFFWVDDAGCSCPSPFENVTSLGDLETGTRMELQAHLDKRANENESENELDEDGQKPHIWGLSREQAQMRVANMMAKVVE